MLLGELDLSGGHFLHTLHEVDEKFTKFLDKLQKVGGVLGGSFVAFEALHKVMEGFEGVLGMGAKFQALKNATGESVHDLVIFSHALEITGGSADQAGTFLFKLQNAIAGVNEDGKKTDRALKAFGVTAAELRALPVLGQVERLQKGLAGIADQESKVAAVKDLLGFRFAAKGLPLLANPEALEEARKQAEPLANVLDKNAHKFHELEVAIKGVGLNFQEFFAGALQGMAPEATSIADALANINFVGIGEGVGALLSVFLKLGEALIPIAKGIGAVSDALHEMSASALKGGALGAVLGGLTAGPLGAVAGALVGGFAGNALGDEAKHEEHHGFADSFRGLQAANSPIPQSIAGHLQKIGGGGGGSGGDPVLSEARIHTKLLERIADAHGGSPSHNEREPVEV